MPPTGKSIILGPQVTEKSQRKQIITLKMFIDEGIDTINVTETEKADWKMSQIELLRVNLN